jgi:dTMP kinase
VEIVRGKFITLEGMDGAGKSTHIPDIIKLLELKGVEVISTREPGGTVLGD